jgi:hypothetical protein
MKQNDLMMLALEAAVPMWIERLRNASFAERQRLAIIDADVIASAETVVDPGPRSFFRKAEIRPAVSFNAVARSIACGALLPLGVDFSGRHWCTDHGECLRVAAATEDRLRAMAVTP